MPPAGEVTGVSVSPLVRVAIGLLHSHRFSWAHCRLLPL